MRPVQAHRELLETSRQVGMAEVATSVLHNVGNVLNSVSISAELVAGKVRQPQSASLQRVAELLRAHAAELPAFLTQDPQGRALPDFRMPPGWDGAETTKRLWQVCPDLQIVICTAYADCAWDEVLKALNPHDRLLILKKAV